MVSQKTTLGENEMEKNRKELKAFSILILVVVALELIRAIVGLCVNGIPKVTEIPEGMTEDMVQISSIIAFALSLAIFIPQIYVAIKGIKVANGEASGKAHMIWAVILAILAGVSVVSGISGLFKEFNFDAVMDLLGPAIDFLMFALYYVYARKIAKGLN